MKVEEKKGGGGGRKEKEKEKEKGGLNREKINNFLDRRTVQGNYGPKRSIPSRN